MNNASSPDQIGADSGTIDREEVAKFNALAASWWDRQGSVDSLKLIDDVA
jgi:2-polyprenyl-3-methyl-5-hydroxy-6-metoxy-1,4-benzoquinol methylase